MINSLEKLKKTLTKNSFGKYLFYSIEESVVVVIRILIVLSINNWNDLRNNNNLNVIID